MSTYLANSTVELVKGMLDDQECVYVQVENAYIAAVVYDNENDEIQLKVFEDIYSEEPTQTFDFPDL